MSTTNETPAQKFARLVREARETKKIQDTISNQANPRVQANLTVVQNSISTRLAALKKNSTTTTELNTLSNNSDSSEVSGIGRDGSVITYNEQQLQFINLASSGESCILIGAAGTGKTTCQQGAVRKMIQNGLLPPVNFDDHKYLPKNNAPGIVICAYTRRAVANIRKAMPADLKDNCITIHKLLEYEPVYYDVIDPETGEEKSTMRFEPTRNSARPLPTGIRCIIFEESSMVSTELYEQVTGALSHDVQFIFLGDIQQLPPVFGSAILGYKMLELPTIELTQVYRQALESPIIRLAHRILSGKAIQSEEFKEWKFNGALTLHPWKKKLHPDTALLTAAKFFTTTVDSGAYDPQEDQILIPFNKSFGTDELNKYIAQHLARQRQAFVYEIIAGFNKVYLSVGDKVLVDKEDAVVVDISTNPAYYGAKPQSHSLTLDYWGFDSGGAKTTEHHIEVTDADMDFMLEQVANSDDEDRVKKCSHIITVEMADSGTHIKLESAGDVNAMLLGYVLTIHKSQGSEWRKVFLVLHQSHATMIQRELLYTGVTRAKEELYVICEPESFIKGIESQRIKGNTLAEKAEYFKGKIKSTKGN